MALFPDKKNGLYDTDDVGIQQQMETFYQKSIEVNQAYWYEADIDTRFEVGDQSVFNDIYNVPAARRKQFSFNRIRPIINMITGYQRRNRKSTIVVPMEANDQETADQFSKMLMWLNKDQGVFDSLSDAFNGACVAGMNLMQVWIDYRNDPINGDIRVDNCAYNSFMIDPYFRKSDLSDCNGIWKRSFLTKQEVMSLLPKKEDLIADISSYGVEDGKFQFLPETYRFDYKNLMTYDEYYYRDYRTQKTLVDTESGVTYEWKSDNDKNLRKFLKMFPSVTLVESQVPTVKLAILVQGKLAYHDRNPIGTDGYPFVPVLGYFNPQTPYYQWRVQGVVRGLRDAQFIYNRRKVIELDIAESQMTSGWVYKEDALVNPKDVFLAGQGKGLALKATAQMTDVQPIQAPQIPPSFFQLSEGLTREIQQIAGVNEELLGSAVDDKAGILAMLRQGAGLTTLQKLFDQLDTAQKLLGRIMIDVIQNNFSPEKVKRIIAEEPTEQFYNKTFGRFDAAVEEGFNTSTQKQVQFAQLLHLKEVGVPIPDDVLLEAATVQNKKKITDSIMAQQEQAQQAQQQQQQLEMAQMEAQIKMANARATADQGLGLERVSRIQENQQLAVERAAQAQENRADARRSDEQALLNMAKTMKELESIDLQNVEKFLALSKMYNELESNQASQDTATSMQNRLMEDELQKYMQLRKLQQEQSYQELDKV